MFIHTPTSKYATFSKPSQILTKFYAGDLHEKLLAEFEFLGTFNDSPSNAHFARFPQVKTENTQNPLTTTPKAFWE